MLIEALKGDSSCSLEDELNGQKKLGPFSEWETERAKGSKNGIWGRRVWWAQK